MAGVAHFAPTLASTIKLLTVHGPRESSLRWKGKDLVREVCRRGFPRDHQEVSGGASVPPQWGPYLLTSRSPRRRSNCGFFGRGRATLRRGPWARFPRIG